MLIGSDNVPENTLFEKRTEAFEDSIGMYYCGKRVQTLNHVYGPEIRSHFLIVSVEQGNAVLHMDKSDIKFGYGDILVMFPGEKIFYRALTEWSIKWIGVSGNLIEKALRTINVTRKNPIFKPSNFNTISNIMTQLYETEYTGLLSERYQIQSLLYLFFSELLSSNKSNGEHDIATSAMQIIKYNYTNRLTVESLASSLYLDCSHFSRIFKAKFGISPKKYILKLQIDTAKIMLRETDKSVKDVAITVGFADSLYFSRLFSKAVGMSPSEYRKKL